MEMEKPHDTESLAWYMHDHPYVFMVVNNDKKRLLRYGGIKKGCVHFNARNDCASGMDMKFEIDKPYSAPIDWYMDRFIRHVSPSIKCEYYYASASEVKEYEWDEFFRAVRGRHEKNPNFQ